MSKLETGLHYPLGFDALPSTWKVGYVGDFALEIQPGYASGKHNKEGVGIPHLRPFNIDRQGKLDLSEIKSVMPDTNAKRLHAGDVLFNNTNSPELIGKTALVASAGDWGYSNHMTRIRFSDDIAPKFAAYQFHFLWMTGYFLHNCVKHVNQASVSSKTLAHAVPFIAPPLEQQKRIVAEIEKQFSRLDEAVANLKRVKTNLKRYKAAVLKAAVEGKLTEKWREEHPDVEPASKLLERILTERRKKWTGKGKYKEPVSPVTANLPELPEGWIWASLGQACLKITDGTHHSPKNFSQGEYKYITSKNVREFRLDLDNITYVDKTIHDKIHSRCDVNKDDVLYVKDGVNTGLAAKNTLDEPFSLLSSVGVFRTVSELMPDYLVAYLNSRGVRDRMLANIAGVAITRLTLNKLKATMIAVPPPQEQCIIVTEVDRRLSLVREAETQVDANLQRAERLRQSILGKAFTGELAHHSTSTTNKN